MPPARPEINLFGGVRLVVEGAVIDRLPTQRVAALLGYLAVHPGWQARESVAEPIWPDLVEGKALASLRNALSVLRRILEPNGPGPGSALESTRTHVRLARAQSECDVWRFQDAMSKREFGVACVTYQGDLLPGIYDDWLEPIRENYRRSFVRAISHEADRALASGEADFAFTLAERWREVEPYDADALRVLVLALAATGDPTGAHSALDRFLVQHKEALGAEPTFDVRVLRSQIDARAKLSVPVLLAARERSDGSSNGRPSKPEPRIPGLPLYLSRFFGRHRELVRIQSWATGEGRLLTLVGMGGVGKTRLSIEAGRALAIKGHDIVFVGLAGARSDSEIIAALVGAFELRESETESPALVLRSFLSDLERPTALILDNLEQVVDGINPIIVDMLQSTTKLKLLCTSRELLGLEGEEFLSVTPLDTPAASETGVPREPAGSEHEPAIQMFLDRARISRSDFALSPRNYHDVAALCRELDGLPLAIEIMAGWSSTWTVAEMRKNVRSAQVVTRKKGHDPRHRSLETCIDWSFNLLAPRVQEFLCSLSLFHGGWTLEAVQAVAGADDAAEMLAGLVDRSLVSSAEVDDGLWFFMLETVRTYCEARLQDSARRLTAQRFVTYYRDLAAVLANPCAGPRERLNHRRLDRERENIEAAVALCEEGLASVDDGLGMLGRLQIHWVYRGQQRAGIALLDRLLALSPSEPAGPGRILGLQTLTVLAQDVGDLVRAERTLRDLQATVEGVTDLESRFRVLTQIGNIHHKLGRFEEACEHQQRALDLSCEMGVPRMEAVAACNLAEALFNRGRVEEAIGYWRRATDLDRLSGNIAGEAMLLLGFGECLTGDIRRGAERLQVYLENAIGLGFGRGYGRAVHFTALPAAMLGDFELARALAASASAFAEQSGFQFDVSEANFFEIVDRVMSARKGRDGDRDGGSSEVPDSPAALDMAEAVGLADRFLRSAMKWSGPDGVQRARGSSYVNLR